ncbi:MAG: M3 family metallopeptidase, partial [Campylobacterales bacterium]|nr:M3 family metallopeptidase [Campylobacterales bacterium]
MLFDKFVINNLEEIPKQLDILLKDHKSKINSLIELDNKSYDNFVRPYQVISHDLEVFITPVFHLDSVCNSETTQKVYGECLPLLSEFSTWQSQNEELFNVFKSIDTSALSNAAKTVVENEIRDFKLGGCGIDKENKNRLKDISLRLSELSKEFSQNLLDSTNEFEMICESFDDVKELPQSDRELAEFEDEDGTLKWKFTLQMPSYLAYITYGTSRVKREEIYKAYCTRAPNNEVVIDEILRLKDEKSKILGFDNYAQNSLSTKMASTEDDVINFLEDLASKAKDKASKEFLEVESLALELDGISDIQSYDLAYYSEKLKKEQYDLDEEEYRPYFESNQVLNGFFDFLNKLFNIRFTKVDTPVWSPKVNCYDISENDKIISRIYIDLEARKEKSGGAWMNNWHTRYVAEDQTHLPTAFIVCNFPQSTEEIPALLRHSDVVTLFHEMGHALHHLLSDVDEIFVSGINGVAWDVVEFPSQFLEYFAYDIDVLKMFAKHYKNEDVLSDEMINRLIKAKNFQSSLALLRQVEFALFDFKLHQKVYQGYEVQNLLDDIRSQISVSNPPSYNKFQNGFA